LSYQYAVEDAHLEALLERRHLRVRELRAIDDDVARGPPAGGACDLGAASARVNVALPSLRHRHDQPFAVEL
jgi:hypothetical protein